MTDPSAHVMQHHCYACKSVEDLIQLMNSNRHFSLAPESCTITVMHKEQTSFSNLLFKVLISLNTTGVIHLIVKRPRDHELLPSNVYLHEQLFYNNIVPFLKNQSAIVPKCYTEITSPIYSLHSFIVMEDLTIKDYRIMNDKLDKDHLKLCMKYLAFFHGRIFKLHSKRLRRTFHINIMSEQAKQEHKQKQLQQLRFFRNAINGKIVNQSYRDRLISKLAYMESSLILSDLKRKRDEKYTKIIIHGRFVRSKVMFRYNLQGKPYKLKILGWQGVTFGSPVIDIGRILLSNVPDGYNATTLAKFFRNMLNTYLYYLEIDFKYYQRLNRDMLNKLMFVYIEHFCTIENYMTVLQALDFLGALNDTF